jgi:GT2 family glycosyltransferase
MKRTAIVLLNWNGRELLSKFLPSVLQYSPREEADILVVDNGSTDDSVEFLKAHYPSVLVRSLDRNYGFAEGYNRALAELNHTYVVLLNTDVEVSPNWLSPGIDYLERNSRVVALQPKVRSYYHRELFEYAGACGGFLDRNGYPFCRGRILQTTEVDNGQYDEVLPVFWATGACLFIRLHDFKEAGGLDASFFAHQEEIDLCWRLNARGKHIVCLPQSVVYHVGGATLRKENPQKEYLNFRNNLLMLYKNLPEPYYSRVMRVRFFLDYLSAAHCLLKGHWGSAVAICKARRDFRRTKGQYRAVREENMKQGSTGIPDTMFPQSLIWNYYVKGKKKFSAYDKRAIR